MSNLKEWMKIVEEGSDSFDSDHSAENLVNYYDDEQEDNPETGDSLDFEFGDKLAIEGTIDSYNENECVINIDPQAMSMLEDLNIIDTTEGFEVLPKMDTDRYQKRDGLEGPIMTRSGKVVYYDNDDGNYYDPDTDMYMTYDEFKKYDKKERIGEEDEYEPHMMYKGSKKDYRAFKPKTKKHHDRLMKSGYDHDDPETKKKEEGYAGGDYASQDEVDEIADSIKSRFMNNPEVFSRVIKATSIDKFIDTVDEVAEFNAPMEEIGSSDMAILMKQVIEDLGLDPKEIYASESIEEAEEHTYTVVHAKHGKEEIKASSSYGAAKKYAEMKKLKGTSGVDAHLHTKEDFDKDHPDFPKAQAFKGEKQHVMDIMKKYPEEAKKLKDGSFDFYGSDLYNELMDYYADEMPYGVMKARDGDPMEWLDSKLDDLGLLDEGVYEAKYQGKTVKLNKPIRTGTDEPKKFKVYVKDGDKVKMVRFGHQGGGKNKDSKTMKIKKSDPKRRKSFRARHNCDNPGPKTKARYWSCRMW